MTAAAQLLDAIVPIVRARLPRGVDGDDLDDFLDRYRRSFLVLLEQNLGPTLCRIAAADCPVNPLRPPGLVDRARPRWRSARGRCGSRWR